MLPYWLLIGLLFAVGAINGRPANESPTSWDFSIDDLLINSTTTETSTTETTTETTTTETTTETSTTETTTATSTTETTTETSTTETTTETTTTETTTETSTTETTTETTTDGTTTDSTTSETTTSETTDSGPTTTDSTTSETTTSETTNSGPTTTDSTTSETTTSETTNSGPTTNTDTTNTDPTTVDSTSSTEVSSSTTIGNSHTVPPQEIPDLSIRNDKNESCILASLNVTLQVKYNKVNNEVGTANISVAFDNPKGACAGGTTTLPNNKTVEGPVIFTTWASDITQYWTKTVPEDNFVVVFFDVGSSATRLSQIQANIKPIGTEFPDYDPTATTPISLDFELGQSYVNELPGSYACSHEAEKSNENGTLKISNVHFEIGDDLNEGRFNEGVKCSGAATFAVSILSISVAFVLSFIL